MFARMSPLFGNREEKAAQKDAARVEIERLCGLSVASLAVEIMPAFGPDGVRHADRGLASFQVANWLVKSYQRRGGIWKQLLDPVSASVLLLERAGLVQMISGEPGGHSVKPTQLGQTALAEGSVERHLAPA